MHRPLLTVPVTSSSHHPCITLFSSSMHHPLLTIHASPSSHHPSNTIFSPFPCRHLVSSHRMPLSTFFACILFVCSHLLSLWIPLTNGHLVPSHLFSLTVFSPVAACTGVTWLGCDCLDHITHIVPCKHMLACWSNSSLIGQGFGVHDMQQCYFLSPSMSHYTM